MRFGTTRGAYELDSLPGSPQVVVSHAAFVHPSYRGEGHGKRDHAARVQKMRELGYDLALCTVVSDNHVQKHILEVNGWILLQKFYSSRSCHWVEVWSKIL